MSQEEILLDISPIPEADKGFLDCSWQRKGETCFNAAEWWVEAYTYCTSHKDQIVREYEEWIAELKKPPVGVNDEDLQLLEIIRKDLEWTIKGCGEGGLGFGASRRLIRELSLSEEDPEAWNIASWYLWKMGLISVTARGGILSVTRRENQ